MIKITSPHSAVRHFRPLLRSPVEEFWAAALTADKTVIASACLFRGTVDQCLFHPRDVFRFACTNNASAVIVAHNHPSGSAQPSDADVAVTTQLLAAAHWLQIPLVDHLILAGRSGYYSFLEDGRLSSLAWPNGPGPGRC